MLDIGFDDGDTIVRDLPEEVMIFCDICTLEAVIFQEEGNFCLDCWQERTHPHITIKSIFESYAISER